MVVCVIRIEGDTRVSGLPACRRPPKSSCRKDIRGTVLFYSGCSIQGRNTRYGFLFLASKRFHGKGARALCRRRWGIELVFSHFKKRGFDLETTHMPDPDKIERLFGVLTLASMISYGWGFEMKRNTTLTAPQKRKGIFRLGLDRLAQLLAHGEDFDEGVRALLKWNERPKYHSIFVV